MTCNRTFCFFTGKEQKEISNTQRNTLIEKCIHNQSISYTTWIGRNQELDNVPIGQVYLKHAATLKIVGIAPDTFPTFLELETLWGQKTKEEKAIEKEEKRKRRKRESFFCIRVSTCSLWTSKHPPMHATIKKLRDKYNLKWLQVNTSYHKFPNLAQAFMGDLTPNLTSGVKSRDFEDEPCNCTRASKVNEVCIFGGECRKLIVIYNAECQECKMCYIGNTQTKVKVRTNLYLGEVCTLVNKGKNLIHLPITLHHITLIDEHTHNWRGA